MRWYTENEFDKRNEELGRAVMSTVYLYLEYCSDCNWPILCSSRTRGKARRCEHCQEEVKAKRKERDRIARKQRSCAVSSVALELPPSLT